MFARATAALMLLFSVELSSAAASPCDSELARSTYRNLGAYHDDTRLAEFVTQDAWRALTERIGPDEPIYGIRAGTNYFDYHMRARLASQSSELGVSQARSIFWSGLGRDSQPLYLTCLDRSLSRQQVLNASVRSGDAHAATIELRYRPDLRRESIEIYWAAVPAGQQPSRSTQWDKEEIFPGTTRIELERQRGSDLVVYATADEGTRTRSYEILRVASLVPPQHGPAGDAHRLYCDFPLEGRLALGRSATFVCHNMTPGAGFIAETMGAAESLGGDVSAADLETAFAASSGGASNRLSGEPRFWHHRIRAFVPGDGVVAFEVACAPANWQRAGALSTYSRGCRIFDGSKLRVCTYDAAGRADESLCSTTLASFPRWAGISLAPAPTFWPRNWHGGFRPWYGHAEGTWVCSTNGNACAWDEGRHHR